MKKKNKNKAVLAVLVTVAIVSFLRPLTMAIGETSISMSDSPVPTPGTYEMFFPIISRGYRAPHPGKGVRGGANCTQLEQLKVNWVAGWSPSIGTCPGIESIPAIWGPGDIGKQLGGNSNKCFTFNEPNCEYQCNLSPLEAVFYFHALLLEYSEVDFWVSPSILVYWDDHAEDGVAWLQEFQTLYIQEYGEPPPFGALAVDCYGPTEECIAAISEVIQLADDWNIEEVWVIEYGYLPCWEGGMDAAVEFMHDMNQWFATQPIIKGYSWFMTSYTGHETWSPSPECNTSLINWETGLLTPLGEEYVLW